MAEFSFNTLQGFIAEAKKKHFARSNRFEIVIIPPQALMAQWNNHIQRITLMIEDTALPGKTIETARLRIHGLTEQRARTADFFGEAINFTFLVDDSWEIKKFFEAWQELMVDSTSRAVGFYSDYVGEVEIRVLSMDDTTTHSITLEEAFPRSFQLVQVSQGNNSIQRFVVAFAFKKWRQNPVNRENLPEAPSFENREEFLSDIINSRIMAAIRTIPLIIDAKISKTVKLKEPLNTITRILGR